MQRHLVTMLVALTFLPSPARAQTVVRLIPPVDGAISHAFAAPDSEFGAGHRGIDYAIAPGTRVRAAAEGTVTFAGPIPGGFAVTIEHLGDVVTTYSRLSSVAVAGGDRVAAGAWIGSSGSAHPGMDGVHLGVKIDGRYVDPETLMTAIDISAAVHLAPLVWTQMGGLEDLIPATSAGTAEPSCREDDATVTTSGSPNGNIAVEVAGITSKTRAGLDATLYENGAAYLGYPRDRIYRFSYRGADGPRFHEPYPRSDTYGDLRVAAARLRSLMVELHRAFPRSHIDLLAHSQGGIVARLFLERYGTEWSPALPQVDHFVTFSTPHRGAPLAGEVDDLATRSLFGGDLLRGAAALSRRGWPVPDPTGDAVAQLAPDSSVIRGLDREDVTFGTRSLALAIPNDLVVPADHATFYGATNRVVGSRGGLVGGHSAIVSSPEARAIAYDFLSDRSIPCATDAAGEGARLGGFVSDIEGAVGEIYGAGERAAFLGSGAAVVPPPVGAVLYDHLLAHR
ncbi:MAG TPA: peptidoglycan DD-metalloendopeptidase family protein [Actinomycetota bacterium]|nr:peptidoglycan DD-metalloendopeptidase family protein [Actinomycetota bacterium]